MDDDTQPGMTRGSISFNMICKHCAGNDFTIPDDALAESRVVCVVCGEDCGSYEELQAAACEAGQKAMEDAFARIFEEFDDSDGITFTRN